MTDKLTGRTALITGGARGIGQAIADALAAEGAKVIIADLLEKEAREAVALIEKNHGQGAAKFHRLDVTDEENWKTLAADLAQEGGVDILINNAGIYQSGRVEEMSLTDWQRIFSVNVEGVFLGCKHIIPLLKTNAAKWKGGASVVNLSSMAGIIGAPAHAAYCASKGAVRLLTKAVALEYAQMHATQDEPLVRVNSIHPGIIDTMMGAQVGQTLQDAGLADNPEGARMALEFNHPIGRFGRPEEIAQAVVFLASDDSSFTTASELVVDGGFTAI